MLVDIVIPVAEKGGVENVINMLLTYVKKHYDWKIRVIQFAWEGKKWLDDSIDFTVFNYGKGSYNAEQFAMQYADYLKEKGAPDVVLASVWPLTTYLVNKALSLSGNNTKTLNISWLHAPVESYQNVGFGGYEYLAMADVHLTISKYIYDEIHLRLPKAEIIQVKNPVNLASKSDLSLEIKNWKIQDRSIKKLLYIGRIAEEKNIETALRGLVLASNWQLRIIGSGDLQYEESLKKLSQSLGISDRVEFVGWKENPWDYSVGANLLVISSSYEGFPLVAIEAMSHGIPVVATPVSGIIELIQIGKNGFIFEKENPEQLAEILNAYDNDILPELKSDFCIESVQKYRSEIALLDFCEKIEELCAKKKNSYLVNLKNTFLYEIDKVSIIVPCYNVEKYVRECLDSIYEQDFPMEMMEVILVNDASPDGTVEILKEYEQRYSNNTLLIDCEKNSGLGAARNIGMQYASGNYIVFIDSDDWIASDYLKILYRKIKLYDCDMAGVGYYKFVGNEKSDYKLEDHSGICYLYNLDNQLMRRKYLLDHGFDNSAWRHMYQSEFLKKNNIFFPEGVKMEDIPFAHKSMLSAKKAIETGIPAYYYRINPKGIIGTLTSKEFFDVSRLQKKTYSELKERNLLLGVEKEYEMVFFIKAFYIPYLLIGQYGLSEDDFKEEIEFQLSDMLKLFPNILENEYLLQNEKDIKNILSKLSIIKERRMNEE